MTIAIVGAHSDFDIHSLRTVAERVGDRACFVPSVAQLKQLIREQVPRCVLVEGPSHIREVNSTLCGQTDCFGVPMIALLPHVSEASWLELHALGADDVLAASDHGGLTRRLAALATFDPTARTPLRSGTALLADAEPDRRQLLGRVLRQAGFEVLFASTEDEACRVADESPPKVVIVSHDLPPSGGTSALTKLAKHWVGAMPAVLMTASTAAAQPSPWLRMREDALPDDLVFAVNELLRPRELIEARASRRVLHATLCVFRKAGELDGRVGLTYNISREGIYVRTFDAPQERGLVWLELRPPGATRCVHLRAETMWIRTLATGARGATPPGFGVRLQPELCPSEDLSLYREHYDQLTQAET